MSFQQGEQSHITPVAQKTVFILFIAACMIPGLLNFLGLHISSHTQAIFPDEQQSILNILIGVTLHATLEWSAIIFSLLGVAASFIHYSLKRNLLVPLIGTALFSSGLIDVFHNIITTVSIQDSTYV